MDEQEEKMNGGNPGETTSCPSHRARDRKRRAPEDNPIFQPQIAAAAPSVAPAPSRNLSGNLITLLGIRPGRPIYLLTVTCIYCIVTDKCT